MEKLWAGPFADRWPRLDNSSTLPKLSVEMSLSEGKNVWVLQSFIHDEAPTSKRALTLGHRLIEGQTRWGAVTKVPREFCFTDCYWEWLEFVVGRNSRILYDARLFGAVTASLYTYDRNSDAVRAFCEAWCPSTNTLHTMAGELSISPWNMWSFGGLPIKGEFYEEVIPSYKKLFSTRDKTKLITCQYLFQAYYSIICMQKADHKTSSKNDSKWLLAHGFHFGTLDPGTMISLLHGSKRRHHTQDLLKTLMAQRSDLENGPPEKTCYLQNSV